MRSGLILATAAITTVAAVAQADPKSFESLLHDAGIAAALEQIHTQTDQTLHDQIEIAQIPAPSFKESVRAQNYLGRLKKLGLDDAAIDSEGNVVARWHGTGTGHGPTLALTAHLDIAFPEGTPVSVTEHDGRYFGPGLGDDSRGLAVLITVLRAMQTNHIKTTGDILFVGTVGEEGLGNLRGARALLRTHPEIKGFISVDSLDAPARQITRREVVSDAVGSHRWSITFQGPGGHSYENFGNPSAIHAMGRAIASIADLRPPQKPKVTFTVSLASGGTSINAIAAEAEMRLDIRSIDTNALQTLENQIFTAVNTAVAAENARWGSKSIHAERKLLADRPAGAQPHDSPVIVAALGASKALGQTTPELIAASTDASAAIGLGIPAATVSGGGIGDQAHSTNEWYEPVDAWKSVQSVLLMTLALVGIPNVADPLL